MESFHKHNPQNHERKIENSGFRPRRFYTLGPTQYSSLWNFFIDKSSVCDRSWKSFSYFLYDLQSRSKSKEKFRSSNKRCCFFGLLYVLRFRSFHPEPAYWIRSGILIKLPQPSSWSQCFFLIESHGFLKAAYQSKRSLILIRDTSKFLPIFIRFLVPQLSPGTGLLNQKSNPHFNTSLNNLVSYQYLSVFPLLNHLCGLFKRAF